MNDRIGRDRRKRRSGRKDEALKLLLEAVRERSDISSIAIIDGHGTVVAGAGPERELLVLGEVAAPAARGAFDLRCEELTSGTDVVSCPLQNGERRLYLAALGERVARMPEAARGVARILAG
jgi:hypothetical protein